MTAGLSNEFVAQVRSLVRARLETLAAPLGPALTIAPLLPGKMLRTQLAGCIAERLGAVPPGLAAVAAAVELVHTASLCHDDVIDNAVIRRARPTLWRQTSPSGAILVGDLLLCAAVDVLVGARPELLPTFIARVSEVCQAETEQELALRGRTLDEAECLRLARGKTGPLFAFAAGACADGALSAALNEAGYHIGTAYQLRDDLLDATGQEATAGKTLGTDRLRRKYTLAAQPEKLRARIEQLGQSALAAVAAYPAARAGVEEFLAVGLGQAANYTQQQIVGAGQSNQSRSEHGVLAVAARMGRSVLSRGQARNERRE